MDLSRMIKGNNQFKHLVYRLHLTTDLLFVAILVINGLKIHNIATRCSSTNSRTIPKPKYKMSHLQRASFYSFYSSLFLSKMGNI